jgi:homocysteine S-methyltransferase
MNREEFRARAQQAPLLLDGATGTLLHSRGVLLDRSFDSLNIHDPAVVATIHGEYIDAGADIIETNTFGANRYKLSAYQLQDEVAAINAAAVTVARRVIEGRFKNVLLAGSVGPLGVRLAPLGRVQPRAAQEAFAEQVEALIHPELFGAEVKGVDLIIIETMSDLKEVEAAVAAVRELAPDIPIVAQLTFTRDDRTLLGVAPADAARRLAELDVDAIGANCSGGPAQLLRLVAVMKEIAPDKLISVSPNAGWPEQSDAGRVYYPATPAYFADYARAFKELGVCIVGGCCGTTPAHIGEMRRALDTPGKSSRALPVVELVNGAEIANVAVDPPTALAGALAAGQFVATVEMRPPKGIVTQRLLEGARMLKDAGANFLDVADNPLARMRMSAWAAAYLIQEALDMEAILHFPTRGRNLLRVQGDLLAAHSLGVRNLFVVMGDPTRIGDYPDAMDSYDIVPTGLIQLIKQRLNQGVDQAEQPIDQPTNFTVGCALSLESDDPDRQLKLLQKKVRNGADFALTQPVFNPDVALRFLERCRAELGSEMIPVVAGIQPLYNAKNAEFLHNEVPGVSISQAYRDRMAAAAEPQAEGVSIAREIVQEMRESVQGVYLIPAFGRYDLAADVLDILDLNAN